MVMAQPHFLLFCDTHHAQRQSSAIPTPSGGKWHFVLEQLDGNHRFEAAESEPQMNPDRLALLSVVRGLEALAQPSTVSLVTTSRYVSRGLRYGLNSWREADYRWESFGVQKPVRNADLWQRVDGALEFHGVTCRLIQSSGLETAADAEEPSSSIAAGDHPHEVMAGRIPPPPRGDNPTSPQDREPWREMAENWWRWWNGRQLPGPVFQGT